MSSGEKRRILIVEDETINLNLLTGILQDEYALILEKRGSKALERAERQQPDLILLDVMIPDFNGYEIITALKNNERTKEIPVIFVSALRETSDEEKGFMLGAVDYITKPYNAAIIRARVRTHMKLVSQRKLLERIAMLDGLTEIPNRRSFTERFTQEWERNVRNGKPLSLMILDVDAFKLYNDNYGHGMGDVALKAVAATMTAVVSRSADFSARIGGEEFAVLLPETSAEGARLVGEEIRSAIEALGITHAFSGVSRSLTVSIGGVTAVPGENCSQQDLFEMADRMLYRAKEEGKNTVRWHHG